MENVSMNRIEFVEINFLDFIFQVYGWKQ